MDPISREPSPSYLPIAGLIAGAVGILLGGIALLNASKASKAATAASAQASAQVTRLEGVETSLATTTAAADRATSNITSLQRSTQEGFNFVSGELTKVNAELAKVHEAATKAATTAKPAAKAAAAGPAVAGPDEYVIAGGDTGAKIARAKNVALSDLIAVNPGVNWTGLKVGQKIKLPAKK